MRALSILLSAWLLTSCASVPETVTIYRPVVMRSPETLRVCEAAPEVPGLEASNYDVAVYIRRLAAAGEDCRRTLAAIVAWEEDAAGRIQPR